jgi:hypothetical protein
MGVLSNIVVSIALAYTVFAAALPCTSYDLQEFQFAKVPDHYIVILKDGISISEFEAHQAWATNMLQSRLYQRENQHSWGIRYFYNFGTLTGYAGAFDGQTIEDVRRELAITVSRH